MPLISKSPEQIIEECQKRLEKVTGKERASIYETIGDAYSDSNKIQKALVCYKEALEIGGPKVRLYDRIGELMEQLNLSNDALALLQESLTKFKEPLELAQLHTRIALILSRRALDKDSHKEAELVLKIMEGVKEKGPETDWIYYRIYNVLGQWNSSEGKLEEGVNCFKKALSHSEKLKDVKGTLNMRNNIGIVLMMMGRFDESLTTFETALEYAEKEKVPSKVGLILVNIGHVKLNRGDLEGAKAACLRSIDVCKETDQLYVISHAQMYLAEIHLEMGDARNAKRWAERALTGFKKAHDATHTCYVLSTVALASMAEGNLDEASKYLDEVPSKELDSLEQFAHAYFRRASGELLIAKGDLKGAERSISKALDICVSLGQPFETAKAYLTKAKLLGAKGKKDEARKELANASKIFEELGARSELAKIERFV